MNIQHRFIRFLAITSAVVGGLGFASLTPRAEAQSSQQAINVSVQVAQSPVSVTSYQVMTNCALPSSTFQTASFPATGGGPIPLYFSLTPATTCTFRVDSLSGSQFNNIPAGLVSVTLGSTSLSIALGASTPPFSVPTGVSVSFGVTYVSSPPRQATLSISVDQASIAAIPELASATNFQTEIQCDLAESQGAVRPIAGTTSHIFTVNDLTGCAITLDLLVGNVHIRPPNIQFRVAPVGLSGSSFPSVPIGQESLFFDLKAATDIGLVLVKVPATPQVKVDVSFRSESVPDPAVSRYDLEVQCFSTAPLSLLYPARYARLNANTDAGRVVSLYPPINPSGQNSCSFRAQARDSARAINPPTGRVTIKVNSQVVSTQGLGSRSPRVPVSGPTQVEFLMDFPSALTNEFEVVDARRLLDTRSRPDGTSLKLLAGETIRVTLPQGKASAINVTATDSESPGYITVFPCGSAQPNASNLNFTVDLSKANLVLAQPGAGNQACVFTSARTHLILDLSGTYPSNSSYRPQNPTRLVDTRNGTGGTNRKLMAGETFRLNLGTSNVASALTVTVTEPERTGYVTVYPCGSTQPNASNLNFTRNSSVANLVFAKAGSDGFACIFVSDPTHLLVDLSGTFPAGSTFTPVTPSRILDSRTGIGVQPGKLVAGQTVRIGVGSGLATVLTVTATDAAAEGYITVYPCGTALPNVSNLNYGPGDATANLVLSPMVGQVTCLFTSAATHLIVDQSGSHPYPA